MRQSGFTLLELSIVLVIIGLLIGGITAGSTLIRQAELQNLVVDANEYSVAARTFELKYRALPGDMANATSYWGAAHASFNTCKTTQGTGTQTCNGDGNRRVASYTTPGAIHSSTYYESFRFWQQLANAGMIAGSYSGVAGPSNFYHLLAGANTPITSRGQVAIHSYSLGQIVGSADFYDGDYNNVVGIQVLSPPDAAWLDTKKDDGKPGSGTLITATYCATTGSPQTAEYLLNIDLAECPLYIRQAY